MNTTLRLTLMVLGTALALAAHAQSGGPFDLKWSTVDGGGGWSTNGAFRLSGTIGQPDAGPPATNGGFTLTGGFWSFASVVQTAEAPLLKIRLLDPETVILSWPLGAQGFKLYSTENLNSGQWNKVIAPVADTADEHTVAVPAKGVRLYRLQKE